LAAAGKDEFWSFNQVFVTIAATRDAHVRCRLLANISWCAAHARPIADCPNVSHVHFGCVYLRYWTLESAYGLLSGNPPVRVALKWLGAMTEATMSNPKSTASIAGHPIHPMLIPFPIAFFVATFVCDLVYWQTANDAWVTASMWLLGAGLVMAALAAVAGLSDVLGEVRIRALNDVWWHAGGNVLVVLVELYNLYIRYSEGTSAIVPKGLVLSLVVVCILLFTGWKGWEMVYRHRVGVADAVASGETTAAHRRAA
jgi:uncharacterized membrane protein